MHSRGDFVAYTITGEKCGTVRLDAEKTGVVVTESVQRSSKVTSNPVEKGSDINDHVINDPVVFSITGVFLDEDQSDILISIHALREEGDSNRILLTGSLSDFYPRPPRGGRRCRPEQSYKLQQ